MIESDIHERSNEPASLAAHGVFRASGGKVTKRVTNFLAGSARSRPKELHAECLDRSILSLSSLSPVKRMDDGEIIYRPRKFRKMSTYVTRERRYSLDMCRSRESRREEQRESAMYFPRETHGEMEDIRRDSWKASEEKMEQRFKVKGCRDIWGEKTPTKDFAMAASV